MNGEDGSGLYGGGQPHIQLSVHAAVLPVHKHTDGTVSWISVVDLDHFDANADPTFHPDADADPDPDPSFVKKAPTLEKVLK